MKDQQQITWATRLRRGADPAQIQALLGHATLETAGRYFRAGPAEQAQPNKPSRTSPAEQAQPNKPSRTSRRHRTVIERIFEA